MRAKRSQKPLWKCPKCGHRFVTRNIYHACGHFKLRDHFKDKAPLVRELFNRLLTLVRACGPMTVEPQKTRIALLTRVRFAGGIVRKHSFVAALWLSHRANHPTLQRVETLGPKCYVHYFRLSAIQDLDEQFASLVREAYAVGQQEHLRSSKGED